MLNLSAMLKNYTNLPNKKFILRQELSAARIIASAVGFSPSRGMAFDTARSASDALYPNDTSAAMASVMFPDCMSLDWKLEADVFATTAEMSLCDSSMIILSAVFFPMPWHFAKISASPDAMASRSRGSDNLLIMLSALLGPTPDTFSTINLKKSRSSRVKNPYNSCLSSL
jgi:hypothetical protein